jgi:hypothetical protein
MDYSACEPESRLQSTPSVIWSILPPPLLRLVLRARQEGYAIRRGQLYAKPRTNSIMEGVAQTKM